MSQPNQPHHLPGTWAKALNKAGTISQAIYMMAQQQPAAPVPHRHIVSQLVKGAPVRAWDDQAAQVKGACQTRELPVSCQACAVDTWHMAEQGAAGKSSGDLWYQLA